MWLRQSTASQEILLGPFLDSTDGNTAETGLTIANTDIKLWVEGATTEASKTSGGATHIASGRYYAVLDATDTATLGKLEINVHVAGALPVRREFMVVPAAVYDAMILGTDNLDVNTVQWLGTACATPTVAGVPEVDITHIGGDAQSQADLKDFADAGYDPATNKVQGVVLVDTTTTNTDMRGTDSAATAAELAKVPKSDGTSTWNATALASIQSEANDALVAYDAATGTDVTTAAANVSVDEIQATALADLFNTDSATNYASAVAGSVVKEIADNAGGSALTEAGIADAVWDELLSGHAISGSAGEALSAAGSAGDPWTTALPGAYGAGTAGKIIGDNIDATISSRATASVCTETRLSELDAATAGKMANQVDVIQTDTTTAIPAQISALNNLSSAQAQTAAAAALTAYDPPTNAEMQARTPSAAQLAYIVSNAADGLPVTFTGGTTTTAILGNVDGAAARSTDDVYNGRILVFNAGTLNQQVTDITDYDGATKTATITAVTTAVTSSHTANMK